MRPALWMPLPTALQSVSAKVRLAADPNDSCHLKNHIPDAECHIISPAPNRHPGWIGLGWSVTNRQAFLVTDISHLRYIGLRSEYQGRCGSNDDLGGCDDLGIRNLFIGRRRGRAFRCTRRLHPFRRQVAGRDGGFGSDNAFGILDLFPGKAGPSPVPYWPDVPPRPLHPATPNP